MITISDLSLNFSGEPLFKDVNLKFTQGNCYGVIGANGAGKSTFLRILSGDLDPSTGTVSIAPKTRRPFSTRFLAATSVCLRSCTKRMRST